MLLPPENLQYAYPRAVAYPISLLTTRSCSWLWTPATPHHSRQLSGARPMSGCGSCKTTFSSTPTSLRSLSSALSHSCGRLPHPHCRNRRQPVASFVEAEIPRRDHRLTSPLRLPRQGRCKSCLLYTSPSPRDRTRSRMPSSA